MLLNRHLSQEMIQKLIGVSQMDKLFLITSQLDEVMEKITSQSSGPMNMDQPCHPQTPQSEADSSQKIDCLSDPKLPKNLHGRNSNLKLLLPKVVKKFEEEQKEERARSIQHQMIIGQYFQEEQSTDHMGQPPDGMQRTSTATLSKKKKIQKEVNTNKKEPYPTKNLLPSFKTSIINYLRPFFSPEKFKAFDIIHSVIDKDGINMKDYQVIFRQQAFRPYLISYFNSKKIYRDLFQSRIGFKTKRIYFSKLHIFERAFKTGIFNGIN